MKIALIVPETVHRPTFGSELRLYQFQTLLERIAPGQVVTWDLGVWHAQSGLPEVERREAQRLQAQGKPRPFSHILRDVAALGLSVWPSFNVKTLGEQRNAILRWIDKERPTHVVLVHPYATELVPALREKGLEVFVDSHSVHSDLARNLVKLAPVGGELLEMMVQSRAIAWWERHYFPRATEVWVPSELDVARQREISGGRARVRCVPNALDVTRYEPRSGDGTHDIVLPASFEFSPNVVGARILRDQVLPAVREVVPDARLVLVGRDKDGVARAFERHPDVVVTGYVPDTRPYLLKAGVVVVPILHGGGTRYKIIEALALGLPVVSTATGAEGLAVRDGEHLLIRGIDEFAGAITSILTRRVDGRKLGQSGRKLVEAEYSWEAVEGIMRQAMRRPAAPSPQPVSEMAGTMRKEGQDAT